MTPPLKTAIRRSRFLVIDESGYHRGIMGEALRALEAGSICNAASVAEAVEQVRNVQPAVVLFEWALSPMDGIAFTKQVRQGAFPMKRDTAMIILTNRSTRDDVETARRAGVDEYLIKPFTTQGLELRLREVFLNRREFIDSPVYVGPCRRRKFLMDYGGPKRRSHDAPASPETEDAEARTAALRAKVQEARRLVRGLSGEIGPPPRQLLVLAKDLERLSGEMSDRIFSSAATSLNDYVAGAVTTNRFDPKVVDAHLDAFEQLISLTTVDEEMRGMVAAALAALVRKKLAR